MLLILTGEIQTGKTRWLSGCIERLESAGIACEGVLAPGVWRSCRGTGGTEGFEKLGIDNVLLPGHELVPFARREDLAKAEGAFDPTCQAAQLGMTWHIGEDALERVNRHFDGLMRSAASTPRDGAARLLVVDELGRLELMRGGGLTSALELLSRGSQGYYTHALVIARKAFGLNERVADLFADAWGGSCEVSPGNSAWERWFAPLMDEALPAV